MVDVNDQEVLKRIDELQNLWRVLERTPDLTMEQYDQLDDIYDDMRNEILKLKNGQVIRKLVELEEEGFDATAALDRWIDSWC